LFKAGARQFWRFLGLFFLTLLVGGTYFGVLVLILILIFVAFEALGLLFLIFFLPMILIGAFVITNVYSLAQREIVVNNTPVFDAIGEAFGLLGNNPGPNIIIFLITAFLWIAIVICGIIITIIFAIPAFIIGAWSTLFMIVALIVILPVFILIAIIIEGFLGTFFNALFTYFYLELQKRKQAGRNDSNSEAVAAN
jgi:hypothetical protein